MARSLWQRNHSVLLFHLRVAFIVVQIQAFVNFPGEIFLAYPPGLRNIIL